jgi:hypothetical protein
MLRIVFPIKNKPTLAFFTVVAVKPAGYSVRSIFIGLNKFVGFFLGFVKQSLCPSFIINPLADPVPPDK